MWNGKEEKSMFKEIFNVEMPVIGVVHLMPLPGAPLYDGTSVSIIAEKAVREAKMMIDNGMDGLIVENFGDKMFQKRVGPETTAALTVIAKEVKDATKAPVGLCVLQSDAISGMAIAKAIDASFIRVPYYVETSIVDAGMMDSIAAETLRYRRYLGCDAKILADIHIKHSYPLAQRPIEYAAEDCYHRGLADAVIITGRKTGGATNPDDLKRVHEALPEVPLIVGSGVTIDNVEKYFDYINGIIIASSLNVNGEVENHPDEKRICAFILQQMEDWGKF